MDLISYENQKMKGDRNETIMLFHWRSSGIGPEIVVKSINNKQVFDAARCVIIGDKK